MTYASLKGFRQPFNKAGMLTGPIGQNEMIGPTGKWKCIVQLPLPAAAGA
jgi:hypothetical protein